MSQESWFALVDNLAAAAALTSDKKKGRAFVTYVPNENSELEQLSFDVSEYMRHKKAEVNKCHCFCFCIVVVIVVVVVVVVVVAFFSIFLIFSFFLLFIGLLFCL